MLAAPKRTTEKRRRRQVKTTREKKQKKTATNHFVAACGVQWPGHHVVQPGGVVGQREAAVEEDDEADWGGEAEHVDVVAEEGEVERVLDAQVLPFLFDRTRVGRESGEGNVCGRKGSEKSNIKRWKNL